MPDYLDLNLLIFLWSKIADTANRLATGIPKKEKTINWVKLRAILSSPASSQSLVGRLVYLSITQLEITYSVQVVAQFMHNPRWEYWDATIWVLWYVKHFPIRDSSSNLILISLFQLAVIRIRSVFLSLSELWLVFLYLMGIPRFPWNPKNSIRFLAPLLRQNTVLWQLLVVSSNGNVRCLQIFDFLLLVPLLFFVIIRQHFILLLI